MEFATNWRFVQQKKRSLLQDQVQLGIGENVQLYVGILG